MRAYKSAGNMVVSKGNYHIPELLTNAF